MTTADGTAPEVSDEAVEAAARAICEAQNGDPDEYEGGSTPAWMDYAREARAALLAAAGPMLAEKDAEIERHVATIRTLQGGYGRALIDFDEARAALAEHGERVASAIEEYANKRLDPERWRGDSYDHGVEEGCEQAARIARALSAPTEGGDQ